MNHSSTLTDILKPSNGHSTEELKNQQEDSNLRAPKWHRMEQETQERGKRAQSECRVKGICFTLPPMERTSEMGKEFMGACHFYSHVSRTRQSGLKLTGQRKALFINTSVTQVTVQLFVHSFIFDKGFNLVMLDKMTHLFHILQN